MSVQLTVSPTSRWWMSTAKTGTIISTRSATRTASRFALRPAETHRDFPEVKRLLKTGWGSLKGAWFSILHYKESPTAVPGSPEAPRNTASLREDLQVKSPNDQVFPNNAADVSSTPRCFLAWLFRDSNILDSDPDAHAALGVARVLTSRLWSAVLRATKHQHPWEELSGMQGHVQFTPCHQSPPTPQLLWE